MVLYAGRVFIGGEQLDDFGAAVDDRIFMYTFHIKGIFVLGVDNPDWFVCIDGVFYLRNGFTGQHALVDNAVSTNKKHVAGHRSEALYRDIFCLEKLRG